MEEEVKSFLQANLSFLWVIVKCNKDLVPIESILENWPYYLDYVLSSGGTNTCF